MNYWNLKNPQLTSKISHELGKAITPDATASNPPLPIFQLLHKHKATFLLFSALNRITNMRPWMGVSNRLNQVRGNSPTGKTVAAIVLGPASKGQVKCFASNEVSPIVACTPSDMIPSNLIDQLSARTITRADQADLIHSAICVAARQQMDSIAKLTHDGAQQRTLVVHLLWAGVGEQHLFSTLAVLDAPVQINTALLYTGPVR